MKIVFMGTPDFAKTILEGVVNDGHEIVAVYTQPDRPKGRSGQPVASPVKEYALNKGFTVCQPERIKRPEEVEILKGYPADVFVVAAYGQILSKEILDMPKYCCINAHGSLLPHLRGSSPIQRAIANGDEKTGVTVQRMDVGMDSGDIIMMESIPIEDKDDEDSMYEKLAVLGSKLVNETLRKIEDNTTTYTKQDESKVTFAPMLTKEEGLVDFNMSARLIDCKVRGFKKWPTAYSFVNGKMLKIYETGVVSEIPETEIPKDPGYFVVTKKKLYVTTGDGLLELLEVQPEGKKRMGAMDFARGQRIETGTRIG